MSLVRSITLSATERQQVIPPDARVHAGRYSYVLSSATAFTVADAKTGGHTTALPAGSYTWPSVTSDELWVEGTGTLSVVGLRTF
jgi:hypothetical protein